MMNGVRALIIALFGSFSLGAGPALAGPTSELYITFTEYVADDSGQFTPGPIAVVQGDGIARQWVQGGQGEYAIAVTDTVKTMVTVNHPDAPQYGFGREYTLAGSPTGRLSGLAPPGKGFSDGTTDGVFNYGAAVSLPPIIQNTVYRFDGDWTNGVPIFELDGLNGSATAITYDPSSNTLWIAEGSNTSGVRVANYSMDGALLSSFRTESLNAYGLAMDPQDGTLWMTSYAADDRLGTLFQFAPDGTVLDEIPHTGGGTGFFAGLLPADAEFIGMEFAMSPGPAGPETNCANGVDDDGDGLIDAADPDCDPVEPEVGLLVRCIHRPLWPEEGEQVFIRAETIDADGNEVFANRIEIYTTDPENPIGDSVGNSSMERFTYPTRSRMRYGCRAELGSEVAFSGWREVDVGTPEFDDLRAVPVIYNGPMDKKIDIVFIPEENRHGAGNVGWELFQSDIYQVILEGIYSIPWFVANQREINFWLGRDTGTVTPGNPDDPSSRCKKDRPEGYKSGYGFADAAGIIHQEDCRDNAAFTVFTTRFNRNRLQVVAHEIGHAAFSLSDEYTGPDSLYFTLPDVPNLLPTHAKCRSAATERGFDPEQCRSLILDGAQGYFLGGLWIFEPNYNNDTDPANETGDLMQQTGNDCNVEPGEFCRARYQVGDSEISRMNWKVGKCRAGRC